MNTVMRKYRLVVSKVFVGGRSAVARLALLAVACLSPVPALASDRWEEAAGGAVAILPIPSKANGITGGTFACAHQQWSFRLRADASVPAGDALNEALKLADGLNARAPNALASIKELVNDASTQTLSEQMDAERAHFVRNLHHPNGGEGISAFLEKRAPRYT